MNRNLWILATLLLLLTGEIVHHIWAHWGLITIHSKTDPLSKVIRSIESQGHVTIKTNLDLTKPVKMYVDEVSLGEALETLSTVTESRWRLSYYIAPDKNAINTAIATTAAGQRNEGWKMLFIPLPPIGDSPGFLADPRKDTWTVTPATEPNLQAYLKQAAKNVSASFMVPENWNPAIKSPPKAGAIGKTLPKLVSAAGGKYQEIFLLQSFERPTADRGDRKPREDDGPRFAGNFGGGGPGGRGGFDAMEERTQNEINKLSGPERAAAQQELDERKQFRESLKGLTDEERKAKFDELMSSPGLMDKMENANNNRDARRTPEQRIQRANGYLSRMAAARAAK